MPLDKLLPVDVRTYAKTLFGNRDPISAKDFTADELRNIREAVQANQKRTGAKKRGNVGYADYPRDEEVGPGYEPIKSTLGRFNYKILPDGSIVATDRYDFLNDERKASVDRYEAMKPSERNVQAPLEALKLFFTQGPRAAAGELGNAFIGREGRDVNITVPPEQRYAGGGGVEKTPVKHSTLLALANALQGVHEFASKPFGYKNPPAEMLSELLGVPAIAKTAERAAYGEPLTSGKGQTTRMLPETEGALFGVAPTVGPLGRLAGRGVSAGARELAPQAGRMLEDYAMKTGITLPVIKPKGGNWLHGSVETAVAPLKRNSQVVTDAAVANARAQGATDADLAEFIRLRAQENAPEQSLNKWLDTKLNKYMKNEMATPEDPIRALAEAGVLHVDPAALNFRPETHGKYLAPGQTAVAKSEAAKAWEGASDLQIGSETAGELFDQGFMTNNPWLAKVPPETPVHMPSDPNNMRSDLGFNHLIDELRNATNPESGLPRNLLIDPAKLDKVTVPQAVEHVAKINAWRAEQKAEADLAKARNPATFTHKEYPEQPLKWVELKKPENLPEGWEEGRPSAFGEKTYRKTGSQEDTLNDPRISALEEALKYEGDVMGHCVGGYCPDVSSGKSRIFSLRNAKGEPHVTIETRQSKGDPISDKYRDLDHEVMREIRAQAAARDPSGVAWGDQGAFLPGDVADRRRELIRQATLERFPEWADLKPISEIVQIKGKANLAPKDDYLPFVQDFVKSGKWGRVNDLQNTRLYKLDPASDIGVKLKAAGRDIPDYINDDDLTKLTDEFGYAQGGSVDIDHDRISNIMNQTKAHCSECDHGEWDSAKIGNLVKQLQEEMYG